MRTAKCGRSLLPVAKMADLAQALVDCQQRSRSKISRTTVLLYVGLLIVLMAITGVTTAPIVASPNGILEGVRTNQVQAGSFLTSVLASRVSSQEEAKGLVILNGHRPPSEKTVSTVCFSGENRSLLDGSTPSAAATDFRGRQPGNDLDKSGDPVMAVMSDRPLQRPAARTRYLGRLALAGIRRSARSPEESRRRRSGGTARAKQWRGRQARTMVSARPVSRGPWTSMGHCRGPAPAAARAKEDRGLPPDSELVELATAYLEHNSAGQRWWRPGSYRNLPKRSSGRVVADFKRRHRTGKVDREQVQPFARIVLQIGRQLRPLLLRQLQPNVHSGSNGQYPGQGPKRKTLHPWSYVFADYSTSGLDASRQGYTSLQDGPLRSEAPDRDGTYIDDFTRAGRDEIEWWRLAALSKRCKKRLIGASDGFDLSNPNSEMLITVFGLLSRLFIKGLREKVRRGMRARPGAGPCWGSCRWVSPGRSIGTRMATSSAGRMAAHGTNRASIPRRRSTAC